MPGDIHFLVAYAVSCFLLNHVLQFHYFQYCRSNIFALFTLGQSGYCAFVEKCLQILQWSPVVVAAPMLWGRNWRREEDVG